MSQNGLQYVYLSNKSKCKKIILEINSYQELEHRTDRNTPNLCSGRLQPICDDCAVRVQWFSRVDKTYFGHNNNWASITSILRP